MDNKEWKNKILTFLKECRDAAETCVKEDIENNEDPRYWKGRVTAYQNIMNYFQEMPSEDSKPLEFQTGDRYKCLEDLYYDGDDDIMFSKDRIYVVTTQYGRVGLPSNDGIVRSHTEHCTCLSTEYFEKVIDNI